MERPFCGSFWIDISGHFQQSFWYCTVQGFYMNVYSLTEWYITYWGYVVLILLNQWSLSIKVMQLVLCRWRQVILNAILCTKMVLFHWWYGHMNICKLSPMIILQRYSQNLPYSTFLMCWVHWYEFTSRFASIRGRVSLINNLLQTSYCTLFFVWVFPWGFSYKVFNEPISTQGCHIIHFSP